MASKQLSTALAAIVSLTAGWVGGANFSTKQETLREVTRYNYLKKRAGGFYDPLFPDFPTKYDIAWAQAHRYHPELLYAMAKKDYAVRYDENLTDPLIVLPVEKDN